MLNNKLERLINIYKKLDYNAEEVIDDELNNFKKHVYFNIINYVEPYFVNVDHIFE